MLTARTWIVCEKSGRWTAALRMAFSRLPKTESTPRLYEARSVGELTNHLQEYERDLALVEVGPANLSEVLPLLVRRGPRPSPFVALLEDGADQQRYATATVPGEPDKQTVVDLLWEIGAVEVVESPRQLGGLLALHHRMATAPAPITAGFSERQSFADWAWSTLPWQDP